MAEGTRALAASRMIAERLDKTLQVIEKNYEKLNQQFEQLLESLKEFRVREEAAEQEVSVEDLVGNSTTDHNKVATVEDDSSEIASEMAVSELQVFDKLLNESLATNEGNTSIIGIEKVAYAEDDATQHKESEDGKSTSMDSSVLSSCVSKLDDAIPHIISTNKGSEYFPRKVFDESPFCLVIATRDDHRGFNYEKSLLLVNPAYKPWAIAVSGFKGGGQMDDVDELKLPDDADFLGSCCGYLLTGNEEEFKLRHSDGDISQLGSARRFFKAILEVAIKADHRVMEVPQSCTEVFKLASEVMPGQFGMKLLTVLISKGRQSCKNWVVVATGFKGGTTKATRRFSMLGISPKAPSSLLTTRNTCCLFMFPILFCFRVDNKGECSVFGLRLSSSAVESLRTRIPLEGEVLLRNKNARVLEGDSRRFARCYSRRMM